MKRSALLMICLLMVLLLCSVSNAIASSDWEYTTLTDGTIEITKYTNMWGKDVVIPDTIDGKQVTSIGDYAFANSSYLVSVTFPDTITHIGNNPFKGCGKLEDFYVSKKHPYVACIDHVLFTKTDKRLVFYPQSRPETTYSIPQGIRIIGESSFYFNEKLTEIVIPDSVVTIENNAFAVCTRLQSISIPGSVISIGDEAFYSCKKLTSITCAEGLVSLGYYTFRDCTVLKSIALPGTLENIPGNPFIGCEKLSSISVNDSPYLSVKNDVLFSDPDKRLICYPRGLSSTSYTIPEGTQIIGDSAFLDNKVLTSVIFPSSLFSIDNNAFSGCNKMVNVSLPEGIYSIGNKAFYKCFALTEITLPEGLDSIGESALSNCTSLRSVLLPDSLSYIGPDAFSGNDMKLLVDENTVGEQYAMDNKIAFEYPGELDWLME